MATAMKTPVGAAAGVLLLFIAAGALASASASALTLHLKQGCIQHKPASCGVCYNIGHVFKGHYFYYYGARPPCSTTGSTAKAATTSSAGTSAAARPPADIKAFSYHATRELWEEYVKDGEGSGFYPTTFDSEQFSGEVDEAGNSRSTKQKKQRNRRRFYY
ncbi:unnamed protein product [Spirodela intermedia]|uniref:Uncharacterized protein n=1 Tax=Spirodela intermedia TaxID=51605 RepID=A0ABN7EAY2_SPIIN|nr:unnamed protein product [Spirodela intermedia]